MTTPSRAFGRVATPRPPNAPDSELSMALLVLTVFSIWWLLVAGWYA